MVLYIIRDFTTDTRRKEAGWCWQAGLWWEVTLAQQRLCLKIPSRDLAVSINRWTPQAWRRGRGSGRKLYLTMITIWHLPELHILDKSSWLSRSPACANEVAGNRILLAPTMATPCGGPIESLFCLFHPPPPPQWCMWTGGRWNVEAAGGQRRKWDPGGFHGCPQSKLWASADDKGGVSVDGTFKKSCFTSLDLTFQIFKKAGYKKNQSRSSVSVLRDTH